MPQILHAAVYTLGAERRLAVTHHEMAQLEVVLDGTLILIQSGKEQILHQGDWAWIAPRHSHAWYAPRAVRCLTVKCRVGDEISGLDKTRVVRASEHDAWLGCLPERLIRAWNTNGSLNRVVAHHLLAVALGSGVIAKKAKSQRNLDEKWLALIDEMHQNPPFKRSLKEMAGKVCLSPVHFRRCFVRHFRRPPGQYQHEQKMKWARDILRFTAIPLKEVAGQAGYSDLAAFSKAFSIYFGIRPHAYRHKSQKVNVSSD